VELTLAERLVEAENAYHQLLIGGQAVEIRDSSGESIRYSMANASKLKAYIAELRALIAGTQVRRPMRPIFG
jgi:hypothetical protein